MARARLLKPGFFTNDDLAELPMAARLLFAGIWTIADREGRLEDRPRRIKAEVLPYDDVDADALLTDLAARGFVIRYERGGIRYLQVTNFSKHQSPHVKEPPSSIPAPDMPDASTVQAPDMPDASTASRAHSPIPHSGIQKPIPEAEPETVTAPAPLRGKAASAAVVPNAPYRLFARFCEEIGTDEGGIGTTEKSKQMGIAKALLIENTEDEAIACAAYLRSQSWRTGLIDLGTVKSEIGKWKLGGSPAQERARAPTNGSGSQHFVTKQEQIDENNRIAESEFLGYFNNGSNGNGPADVQRADEPPRRRLSH